MLLAAAACPPPLLWLYCTAGARKKPPHSCDLCKRKPAGDLRPELRGCAMHNSKNVAETRVLRAKLRGAAGICAAARQRGRRPGGGLRRAGTRAPTKANFPILALCRARLFVEYVFAPEGARGHADRLGELGVEMAGVVVAHLGGDARDRQVGGDEQGLRLADAAAQDVLQR